MRRDKQAHEDENGDTESEQGSEREDASRTEAQQSGGSAQASASAWGDTSGPWTETETTCEADGSGPDGARPAESEPTGPSEAEGVNMNVNSPEMSQESAGREAPEGGRNMRARKRAPGWYDEAAHRRRRRARTEVPRIAPVPVRRGQLKRHIEVGKWCVERTVAGMYDYADGRLTKRHRASEPGDVWDDGG